MKTYETMEPKGNKVDLGSSTSLWHLNIRFR